MTDSELIEELLQLGLKESEFSIKLSSQFADFHLQKGINCYEVFQREERGGIRFKREFENDQLGKRALIDLVRIIKGYKPKYNKIDNQDIFYTEQSRILNLIKKQKKTQDNVNTYDELYELIFHTDFKNPDISRISKFLIQKMFVIDTNILDEIFLFKYSFINE